MIKSDRNRLLTACTQTVRALGIIFILFVVCCGCEKPFDRSAFFKGLDAKAVISAACEQEKYPLSIDFEFEETTLDYSLKQCEAVVVCEQSKRSALAGDVITHFRDQAASGGVVQTGSGTTPDHSRERIPFKANGRAGQIIMYAVDIDKTKVKLIFTAFECRAKSSFK